MLTQMYRFLLLLAAVGFKEVPGPMALFAASPSKELSSALAAKAFSQT